MTLILGLVIGVLWSVFAPNVRGVVTESGVAVRGAQARQQFDVDGWFALLGAGAGLISAVAFIRHRTRPVLSLITMVLGGMAGSAGAWRVGVMLGPGPVDARASGLDVGASVAMPLALNAPGVLLVWPIAAAMGVVVAAAALDDRAPWRGSVNRPARSWRSWRR